MKNLYRVLSTAQPNHALVNTKAGESQKKTKKLSAILTAISAMLATTLESTAEENIKESIDDEGNSICELDSTAMLKDTASLVSALKSSNSTKVTEPLIDDMKTSSLVDESNISATKSDVRLQTATLDKAFGSHTTAKSNNANLENNQQPDIQLEDQLIGAGGAQNIDVPIIHIQDRSQTSVDIQVEHLNVTNNTNTYSASSGVQKTSGSQDTSQSELVANLKQLISDNADQIANQNNSILGLTQAQSKAQESYDERLSQLASKNKDASEELRSKIDALAEENANQIAEHQEKVDKLQEGANVDRAELHDAIDALRQALQDAEARLTKAIEDIANNDDDAPTSPNVLFGTSQEDSFTAYDTDDTIYAMSGDDKIDGGLGADTLYGGEGIDLADYRKSATAVEVNLEESTGKGGHAEGDVYFQLEGAIGSDFNDDLFGSSNTDYLFGGKGEDVLNGNDGQDYLSGDQGADFIDGGSNAAGTENGDYANYTSSDEAVDVSLFEGQGYEGDAAGDTLINIENVNGSLFDDYIEGDNNANLLNGSNGDDELVGLGGNDLLFGGGGDDILSGDHGNDILTGGKGADYLEGGDGIDTADYSQASEGVLINMTFGGLDGEALGDVYDSIEIIQGSNFDDGIVGDAANNTLLGGAGEDGLFGGDGDDYLIGGTGNDSLRGGQGNDVFVFHGEFDNDYISGFEGGEGISDQIHIADEFVTSFEDVLESITTNGFDVVLTLEGGSVTLENTTVDQLAADDFLFG